MTAISLMLQFASSHHFRGHYLSPREESSKSVHFSKISNNQRMTIHPRINECDLFTPICIILQSAGGMKQEVHLIKEPLR
mmetsp:Transcript_23913/g.48445  ORF Transcript_23913/g.48445 Transcript_23913/m.48445 type:complete len:80 (-) Transcript_23913:724-963(-)